MVETLSEANLFEQGTGAFFTIPARHRNQGKRQHILKHGTLWEQAVVLKNETDLSIPECGKLFFFLLKWILTVERDSPAAGRLKRAHDVQQCALAAARWTHDRYGIPAR